MKLALEKAKKLNRDHVTEEHLQLARDELQILGVDEANAWTA